MTIKSKLAMIAASAAFGVAALGIASPALAQSGLHGYAYAPGTALVPGDPPVGPAITPDATGGGSSGYNWKVQHDY